jgi:hypothetical protein
MAISRRAAVDGSEAALFGSIAIHRGVSVEEILNRLSESSELTQGADGQKWSVRWWPRETKATTASQTAEFGSMAISADLRVSLIGIAQGCGIAAGVHALAATGRQAERTCVAAPSGRRRQ